MASLGLMFDHEPILDYSLNVVFSDIAQPNVMTGLGQQTAKQASHCPGAHNGYFLLFLLYEFTIED